MLCFNKIYVYIINNSNIVYILYKYYLYLKNGKILIIKTAIGR